MAYLDIRLLFTIQLYFNGFYIGQTETYVTKMRSILAQYDYKKAILEWEKKGVPFRTYLYVPEVIDITNEKFHQREDEGHMLKV